MYKVEPKTHLAIAGVGFAWLIGVVLVLGATILSFRVGLEPLATGITLVSGSIGSFTFFRERSLPARLLIAVLIAGTLLAMAGLMYYVLIIAEAIFGAISIGIFEVMIVAYQYILA